jgi:hypothetical protein
MQTLKDIYLFTTSCNIKYATYIVDWRIDIKAAREGGVLLSRLQNIAEATPPARNRKEGKKPTTLVCCEQ